MLVDVRPMRARGHRLSRDQIKARDPTRGELVVDRRHDHWLGGWVPMASIVGDDKVTPLLPPLDQVRILRWSGVDLVLVGLEEIQQRKQSQVMLQSWWCRVVC